MGKDSAIVILNRHSGGEDKRKIVRVLAALAAEVGSECEFVLARNPAQILHAAGRAAASACHTVVAGGGDGTVNAVASQLVGTEKRLGILPLGTFNYFARDLGLPLDLDRAFRACFEGATRAVTVGEVNGRIFLNNAGIGLYPLMLSAREQIYRRWGRHRLGAYWSVVKTVLRSRSNLKLTITTDGNRRTVRTPLLFIARNSYQLEQFNVPGIRCVAGEGFSVYILRPMDKSRLIRSAFRVFAGRLEPFDDFETFCTSRIRVESQRIGRTIAFDGERARMVAPLEFRLRQHALHIAVPAAMKDRSAA